METPIEESVDILLKRSLIIPPYQRPYKWTKKNVDDLLNDIEIAIKEKERYGKEYWYRIGSVILYKPKKQVEEFEIVDGQQRLITLALIKYVAQNDMPKWLEDRKFDDSASQENIKNNYDVIKERFANDSVFFKAITDAFKDTLQAVIFTVDNQDEAFQLFDSQNTRGKELDPHDLLKAYHLRETDGNEFEKRHLVNRWENENVSDIRDLFGKFLFPILNWTRMNKTKTFTAQHIGNYKGVTKKEVQQYTYAIRAYRTAPYFQANETFTAGKDFFDMVDHYLSIVRGIVNEIEKTEEFHSIKEVIDSGNTIGHQYAVELFYTALFFYYDRFRNLDFKAVKKLFVWAMMIRVDMNTLGKETINNYAIGTFKNYSNNIPMFYTISYARNHYEIANLKIFFNEKFENSTSDEDNFRKRLLDDLHMIYFGENCDE